MEPLLKESRIILALEALKKDPKLSVRKVATIYEIPKSSLHDRHAGKQPRREISANLRKLTDLEEKVLLERVLDLDARGFQPRLSDIREMADRLRTIRDASRVGPRWANNFVDRHPEVTTRFRRRIDYQRTQCEDPDVVNAWFRLVRNVIDKYAIQEGDIYNFDETGFQMGILSSAKVVTSSERHGRPRTKQPGNREWVTVIQAVCADGWVVPPYFVVKGKNHLLPWYQDSRFQPEWRVHTSENGWTTNEIGLDWLKHFDQSTKRRTRGVHRLLILDGHESHHSVDFEDFCKANNIVSLCMPPHSSHFLQPLDVGCFSPLKVSYGKQIEQMMRMQITHITKEDFFDAFVEAFHASITQNNVRAGFRAAGLVPFDPESVISRLDPKPITPSPSNSRPGTASSWVPKTPSNAYDATQSSSTLKRKIENHQGSSPTHIFDIIDLQAKSISKLAHEIVLLRAETKELRTANERLSKRRRTKKTRLQDGGSLSLQEATVVIADRGLGDQDCEETSRSSGCITVGEPRVRLCSNCRMPGHNARTCQVVCETSGESDSE
jgi:hypothetical protein